MVYLQESSRRQVFVLVPLTVKLQTNYGRRCFVDEMNLEIGTVNDDSFVNGMKNIIELIALVNHFTLQQQPCLRIITTLKLTTIGTVEGNNG